MISIIDKDRCMVNVDKNELKTNSRAC